MTLLIPVPSTVLATQQALNTLWNEQSLLFPKVFLWVFCSTLSRFEIRNNYLRLPGLTLFLTNPGSQRQVQAHVAGNPGQASSTTLLKTQTYPTSFLPIRTEKKKCTIGMFRIGAERFKNQFGVMGKSLKNSKKKNRLFLFSSTCSQKRQGQ